MIKLAIIIPLYNHGEQLKQTIKNLTDFDIPILIVNDGSNEQTLEIATNIEKENQQVSLISMDKNSGKGAAVMHGMRTLYNDGYTHAFQIDADGQHDANKIPVFIENMQAKPSAVITGNPIFDETIPKSRYYGKFITHFFVCLETLSLKVPDTMCGMRIYPLKSCMQLFENTQICKRMDFDTDIMVRLLWQNVPAIWVPIKVIYPTDGISHFQTFDDNVRITLMHTRLCLGAIWRLPKLVFKGMGNQQRHWSKISERGCEWGMYSVLWAYKIFGRKISQAMILPILYYFYISAPAIKNHVKDFLSRTNKIQPNDMNVFRTYWEFGDSILDRLDGRFDRLDATSIMKTCPNLYDNVFSDNRGGLIISSHLGNVEICRCLERKFPSKKIHALVHHKNAAKFNNVYKSINPEFQSNLMEVSSLTPEVAIDLSNKIEAGDIIALAGDRTSVKNEGRAIEIDFLGEKAPIPEGPFILGAALKCPVYLIFCIKINGAYKIFFEKFTDKIILPRGKRQEALQEIGNKYAKRLEHFALMAPHQWFNFFDFWKPAHTENSNE